MEPKKIICYNIKICIDNLYNGSENPPNIPSMIFVIFLSKPPKNHFLRLATLKSSLGPALANFFMCSLESRWP